MARVRLSLEQRYRRLLRWYPAGYRRDHEDEILGVLMAAAPPGRRRPGLADAVDLIWGGVRTRFRFRGPADAQSRWHEALGIYSLAGTVLILFTTVLLEFQPSGTAGYLLGPVIDAALPLARGCGSHRRSGWRYRLRC